MTTEFFPEPMEPKTQSRFKIVFPSKFGIDSYLIKSASKPTLTYHSKSNYEWGNISIEMYDVVTISISNGLLKLVNHCKNKKKKFEEGGVAPEKRYLFTFTMQDLDPTGLVIETWMIKVKDVVSVDFGENDYGSNDLQKLKIVLAPLSCVLA